MRASRVKQDTCEGTTTSPRSNRPRRAAQALEAAVRQWVEPLEVRQLLSGVLDPTFGTGGKVFTEFLGPRVDEPADVVVQADGKFVVGGASTDARETNFALARYNADGTLDASFGNKGMVQTDINLDDRINDVALQSDGKIVVAGFSSGVVTSGALEFDFALARYNSNGSLDPSFGTNGIVTIRSGVYGTAQRVLIMPDGKIVVGGATQDALPGPSDFALFRLTATGALDPTFGTGGITVADVAGDADAPRDFLAVSGKILAVGDTIPGPAASSVVLARFSADGHFDPSFGTGGKTIVPAGANGGEHAAAAAVLANGNIIVVGNDATAFTLRRFNASGNLDPTFGTAGVVRKDVSSSDGAARLVVLPGGKLLLGGTVSQASEDGDYALLRFNADGSPDATFGTGGGVAVHARPGAQFLDGLVARPDGSILAVGSDSAGIGTENFDVVRYTPQGAPDATFGRGGVVSTDFQSPVLARAADVAVQTDGKVVAVGTAEGGVFQITNMVAIARYLPGGGLDPSFGVGGLVKAGNGEPTRVFVGPDGRIVVAAIGDQGRMTFRQFNANGSPDTSFGANGIADTGLFAEQNGANVVRLSDGKLLVAGGTGSGDLKQLAVARINPDGQLDAAFGTGGIATAILSKDFMPFSLAVAPDGKLVVGGGNRLSPNPPIGIELALVRLLPGGTLDTTFGNGGMASGHVASEAVAVALQSDGAIVATSDSGGSGTDMKLTRFTSAGTFDSTFGVNAGTTALPVPVRRLLIEPGDTILAAGAAQPDALAVARFGATGRPDTTFGSAGVAKVAVPQFASAGGLALDGSNRIVIAGAAGGQFAVARLTSDVQSPFAGASFTLPGTLEFENFDQGVEGVAYHDVDAANLGGTYRETGVDVQAIPGGGFNLGYAKAGEWTEYTVDVSTDQTGSYDVALRYASLRGGGKFHLELDGKAVTSTLALGSTGNWQNYQAKNFGPIFFAPGRHVLRLVMDATDATGYVANFDSAQFTKVPAGPQTPFGGNPIRVGATGGVDFENFDEGGEGVSFHDTDAANLAGAYRDTPVDVQAFGNNEFAIAFARAGEWTEYTLDIAQPGTYSLSFRLASLVGGGKFHLELDGRPITKTINVPRSGNWQRYFDMGLPLLDLPAGRHVLRLAMDANDYTGFVGNFDHLSISKTLGANSTPFHGTPFQPGQTIEAEDFNFGGEGFAYHDTEAQNLGAADYRPSNGVDIEPTGNGGGFNVGYANAGEWLEYTVNGPTDGALLGIEVNVASLRAGGQFHFEVDGQNVATFTVPATGSWQAYTTLSTPKTLRLTAGPHRFRLVMDQNNPIGYVANFDWIRLVP